MAALPTMVGCGVDDSARAADQFATEFTCTAPDAQPGQPRVYFAPFESVEQQVLCTLDRAQHEVLVAQYNIRRSSYLDKLVSLRDRGVTVKVAVDRHNAEREWNVGDDFLEDHGIEIVRTSPCRSGCLMHLKVTVVDSAIAMTGSFNWNGTASLANDENMVVVAEPELVDMYRNQVLEVLGEKPHETEGGDATDVTALHFSPEQHLDDVLRTELSSAIESVDIAMFTFSSDAVADAVVDAAQRGVAVRAVLESKQTGWTEVDDRLEQAGVDVVRGANRIGSYSAMHHKYAIIDGRTVITGATNWTYTGTRRSDEDLLVLDLPELAARYRRNFADLLHVYRGEVVDDVPDNERAGVLLRAIHEDTAWGDRLVVTGNHPALGSWDPWQGIPMDTSESLFPNWTGRALLPAGTRLEYKYVTLTASGGVWWEPGPNRALQVPESGRAVVVSGPFGDTATNWSPTDEP
jgi:phosphatidylserine/phosphatidylglycerophosphate/cardiolipin synthase-like enzyme